MCAMNRRAIRERMEEESRWERRLIVEPYFGFLNQRSSASASIDFHLGNRFTVFRRRRDVLHDPQAHEADVLTEEFFVSLGDRFVLHPGHIVLGTTLEWFRFPLDLMAYVVGRSIWGRRGLMIATATAVQPGSAGTITLELSNTGEIAVALKPGVRIGQLFFHEVEAADEGSIRTRFSGALKPVLGNYIDSPSEAFLLGLSPQILGANLNHNSIYPDDMQD